MSLHSIKLDIKLEDYVQKDLTTVDGLNIYDEIIKVIKENSSEYCKDPVKKATERVYRDAFMFGLLVRCCDMPVCIKGPFGQESWDYTPKSVVVREHVVKHLMVEGVLDWSWFLDDRRGRTPEEMVEYMKGFDAWDLWGYTETYILWHHKLGVAY